MSMEEKEQAISESLQDVSVEYTTFGKRLRHIRKERKMTQEDFAKLLGTSKQILSRYHKLLLLQYAQEGEHRIVGWLGLGKLLQYLAHRALPHIPPRRKK